MFNKITLSNHNYALHFHLHLRYIIVVHVMWDGSLGRLPIKIYMFTPYADYFIQLNELNLQIHICIIIYNDKPVFFGFFKCGNTAVMIVWRCKINFHLTFCCDGKTTCSKVYFLETDRIPLWDIGNRF